jgi:hypothetical protein
MAGDWIKMRIALSDDPAVISMAESLSIDEFSVVGRLHHLWGWADTQSRDGHADGVTQRWIDRYVRCDGFAQAMTSVGWLAVTDTGIEFPNFDRHNGDTAKSRGLATSRKQKQRSVTDESRGERDKNETREEKRREELTPLHTPRASASISIVLRKYSINSNPSHPVVLAMAEQGVDLETLEACCKETREAKPNETIAVQYIAKKLEGWKAQASQVNVAGAAKRKVPETWFLSANSMSAKARELGIPDARMGETEGSFKSRIQQAINQRSMQ